MIKQLPTKCAEYPMPLLVRKLKTNKNNLLKYIFLINQTLKKSTHLNAFCCSVITLYDNTLYLNSYQTLSYDYVKETIWTKKGM